MTIPHLPPAHVVETGSQHTFALHAAELAHVPQSTSCPQLFFASPHALPAHVVARGSGAQPSQVPAMHAPASH